MDRRKPSTATTVSRPPLEQAAGVDGLGLIVRDGKNRLVNHGFEHVFGHWDLIFGVDFGHGREVVRGCGHKVENRAAALDGGQQFFVGLDIDHIVWQFADDVAQELGAQDNLTRF